MSGVLFFDGLTGTVGTRQGVPELLENFSGVYQNIVWGVDNDGLGEGLDHITWYAPDYNGAGYINQNAVAWAPTEVVSHRWFSYSMDLVDQSAPVTIRMHFRCHSQGAGSFSNGLVGIRVGTTLDGTDNSLGEAFLTASEVENGVGRTLTVSFTAPADAEAYVSEAYIMIGIFEVTAGLAPFTIEVDNAMYEAGPGLAANPYGTGAPGPLPTFTDRPYNYGRVEYGAFGPGGSQAIKMWGYTPNAEHRLDPGIDAGAVGVRFILDALPNSGDERCILWCGDGLQYTELRITSAGDYKLYKSGAYTALFSNYVAGTTRYVELWSREFLGNSECLLYIEGSYAGTLSRPGTTGSFRGGGFGDRYVNDIYDNVGCTFQDFYVKDMVSDTTLLGPNVKMAHFDFCAGAPGVDGYALPTFTLTGGSILAVAPDITHSMNGVEVSHEWDSAETGALINLSMKYSGTQSTVKTNHSSSAPRCSYEYDPTIFDWKSNFYPHEVAPGSVAWTDAVLSASTVIVTAGGTGTLVLHKTGIRVLYTGTLTADYSSCGGAVGCGDLLVRRNGDWRLPSNVYVKKNLDWRNAEHLFVRDKGQWWQIF
jgi:hypothetical protein